MPRIIGWQWYVTELSVRVDAVVMSIRLQPDYSNSQLPCLQDSNRDLRFLENISLGCVPRVLVHRFKDVVDYVVHQSVDFNDIVDSKLYFVGGKETILVFVHVVGINEPIFYKA